MQTFDSYNMRLNTNKTKIMITSKDSNINEQCFVKGCQLQRVPKLTYLDACLNEKWDQAYEIRDRIEKARPTFNKINILCDMDLSLNIRIRKHRY